MREATKIKKEADPNTPQVDWHHSQSATFSQFPVQLHAGAGVGGAGVGGTVGGAGVEGPSRSLYARRFGEPAPACEIAFGVANPVMASFTCCMLSDAESDVILVEGQQFQQREELPLRCQK